MTPHPSADAILDVIVVGGGPAGLSAALVLGRSLRRVLVCDAGHPRNEPAKVFNGYLSRDGSTPGEFLKISREQLQRYETVEQRQVMVVAAERGESKFTVTLATGEVVEARMLLLATGLIDELPNIEGLREFYGKSAHSCPYCDGWECRGQPIAVLGGDDEAADLAIELLQWSKDVIVCSNGPLTYDETQFRQMKLGRIAVIETEIVRIEGEDEALSGIRFKDGSFLPRAAVFFWPRQHQRSPLAERLGCTFCEKDDCIQCDEDTSTGVPGLYVAGNASRGIQLVIAAVNEGTRAAVAINNALIEADAEIGALK